MKLKTAFQYCIQSNQPTNQPTNHRSIKTNQLANKSKQYNEKACAAQNCYQYPTPSHPRLTQNWSVFTIEVISLTAGGDQEELKISSFGQYTRNVSWKLSPACGAGSQFVVLKSEG